ncbi:UEV domain-containing protein [Sordaria brevicollis]|uniref:UEV domain-containing protein n=1 Tax=Sordaria brevicollis TaxID=83679 RepID=A0AAE0UE04_SORBR|nr:UEV domain-containing protein [Sordaria brevicollis]
MVVQQHVLNWLYSVLTSEYHDVNRTYNDVAQALSHYPSLSPRTDVHTFPNGASALLVHLSGTLPVVFRGTTYRFPISVWVPHAYPKEAPLVYVTPTEHIMVRPGQHVDPQGQVYHPYLANWSTYWDKSTLLDFLAILRDVFAKEPPVIARPPQGQGQAQVRSPPPQQQQQPQPPSQGPAVPTPPPVPPLPQELAARSPAPVQSPVQQDGARPPPPPPKPGAPAHGAPIPHHQASPAPSYAAAPPVPPHPPHPGRPTSQYGSPAPQSPRSGPSRYDAPPPLPPNSTQQQRQQPPQQPHGAPYHSPPPPMPAALPHNQGPAPTQPPYSPMTADPRRMSAIQQPPQHYNSPQPPPNWQQQQQPQGHPPQAFPPHHHTLPPQQPQPKPPPPPDLLDDDTPSSSSTPNPLTNLGGTDTPAAPPPPPPNPEKDALLHRLSQTLHSHRQHARQQNESSLSGLAAQRSAMNAAANTLQSEYAQLSQLSALLQSNTAILQESIRKADAVIENSKTLKEPDIDELLVAPTVVGNQLYELVAEERALADAIFMLGRAVERGRIPPQTHAKMVRGLAREWYLKKALVKKIGDGMGLSQY